MGFIAAALEALHTSFTAFGVIACALLSLSTGRALAQIWAPLWQGWLACVPLTAALRFLHGALFGDDSLNPAAFFITLALNLLCCTLAYHWRRHQQIKKQYDWLDLPYGADDR
jgi:hypothetical protein